MGRAAKRKKENAENKLIVARLTKELDERFTSWSAKQITDISDRELLDEFEEHLNFATDNGMKVCCSGKIIARPRSETIGTYYINVIV